VNVPPAAAWQGLLWRDLVRAAAYGYRRRIAVIVRNREEMLPRTLAASATNRHSRA